MCASAPSSFVSMDEELSKFSANANPLLVYLIPFLECTQEHHSSDSLFFLSVISFLLPSGSFSPPYKHIVTSSILKQEQRQPPLILLFFLSCLPLHFSPPLYSKIVPKSCLSSLSLISFFSWSIPNWLCLHHSTEIALAKVTKDLHVAKSKDQISIFIYLDLQAALDTSMALPSFSFTPNSLAYCSQFFAMSFCSFRTLNVGVPQNSYCFPSVFSHSFCDLIWSYGFKNHLHANDAQIYISYTCLSSESASRNSICQLSISIWTSNSHLKFNVFQTYLLILASLPLTSSSSRFSISKDVNFISLSCSYKRS